MASVVTEGEAAVRGEEGQPVVNDVVINVATVNGSGSQSANLILMRSIFSMGIPVSGKNLFPSNIEGLPTWFTIRANQDGWLAQRTKIDFLVAMNARTIGEDVAPLDPGAMVVVNEKLKSAIKRDDLVVYGVPFDELVKDVCSDTRLRKKIVNVIYVGVVAQLLGIDMKEVDAAVDQQFGTKPKAAKMNKDAAQAGFDWATANLPAQNNFRLERANATANKIIIEGNEATALGMMFGGVTVCAWYPITPSSSVCETLSSLLDQYRRDPETGEATYAVIQAEDEIASMGMVLGASWAGARAFTATAGPGISLMSEMAGLSYFAEIPAVIVDVQRMGPSTGLPTRTNQGDVVKAYNLSHGDCHHVVLLPGDVQECYEFAMESLELAEQLQTLVFLLSDLDLGMNKWMADPFPAPSKPIARGKVLNKEDLDRLGGFERYADVDGDGIGYRTLPGTHHPNAAFFTRGTGHTPKAEYSEKPAHWQANMDRLKKKFDTAKTLVPQPVVDEPEGAEVAIIAYGSTDTAMGEARHLLETRHGIKTAYMRVRALPVGEPVRQFILKHKNVFVIDQNRDAQMAGIFKSELDGVADRIKNILHYNGMPIDAESIVKQVVGQLGIAAQ